jgi:hypothetical protein
MKIPQPNLTSQPTSAYDPDDFDVKDWIMDNICLNDPVKLRRNELRRFTEEAAFEDVDVRNLSDLRGWEMRSAVARTPNATWLPRRKIPVAIRTVSLTQSQQT